jgi:hypothetical protein
MRHIYLKLKWGYQRLVRGWDDTAMWGLDEQFITTVVEPLEKLCIDYLADKEHALLNEERAKIYSKTLDLIDAHRETTRCFLDDWSGAKEQAALTKLIKYFGQNIGWYWD